MAKFEGEGWLLVGMVGVLVSERKVRVGYW